MKFVWIESCHLRLHLHLLVTPLPFKSLSFCSFVPLARPLFSRPSVFPSPLFSRPSVSHPPPLSLYSRLAPSLVLLSRPAPCLSSFAPFFCSSRLSPFLSHTSVSLPHQKSPRDHGQKAQKEGEGTTLPPKNKKESLPQKSPCLKRSLGAVDIAAYGC